MKQSPVLLKVTCSNKLLILHVHGIMVNTAKGYILEVFCKLHVTIFTCVSMIMKVWLKKIQLYQPQLRLYFSGFKVKFKLKLVILFRYIW